jgi:hypothetical protein
MWVYLYTDNPFPYEFSYNFRNKTLAQIQTDWWTSYDKTPSFDADGMYSSSTSSSNDVRVKRIIPWWLSTAKKITITLNYKWNSTVPWVNFWVNINSDNSSATWVSLQWTYRWVVVDGSTIYSINNASSTAWTYSETLVLDLVNKTYTVSGHRSYTRTLTDAQIANLKTKTWLYVYSCKSSSVRVQYVKMAIE